MISFSQKGDFKKLTGFLEKSKELIHIGKLDKYGRMGVEALYSATPKDTGKTASSWSYKIRQGDGTVSLEFHNSNVNNYVPIAIILQYGHATRSGSFVQGIDYINPALRPVFNDLAREAWKEVTKV